MRTITRNGITITVADDATEAYVDRVFDLAAGLSGDALAEAVAEGIASSAPAVAAAAASLVEESTEGVTINLPDGTVVHVAAVADPHQAALTVAEATGDGYGDGDLSERISECEQAIEKIIKMLEGKTASAAETVANEAFPGV